ncbi:MAG: UvrD-helicase domain-containing protein [Prevotellaceae bacterium]|jgi:ATP-dependent exoDNAse (exonuclease V) beta subunit|nr:UvrD-helicase domain-containing protein [Prevotellaceae bacterium]
MSDFLILKASAGSGKTYNLALHYILQLILNGQNAFRQILAVTFTKDATEEMKMRILENLYALACGLDKDFLKNIKLQMPDNKQKTDEDIQEIAQKALINILHDYNRFNVGTIDSFFQRVLRNLARELGKGSKFNTDLNCEKAIADAVSATIDKSNKDTELLGWIEDFIDEKIQDGKKWRIDKDLNSFGRHIFDEEFLQKHQTLSHTISQNPDILKNTIKECEKIRNIFIKQIDSFVNNFKQINQKYGLSGNEFFRRFITAYYNKLSQKTFDDDDLLTQYVKNGLDNAESWFTKQSEFRERLLPVVELELMPLLQETEKFRNDNLSDYNSAVMYLKNIFSLGLINFISDEIDSQSKDNNRFMLQNTAVLLASMMSSEQNSNSEFIFEKIGAEIQNVMIDEFQDTSVLQWKNFHSLLLDIIASGSFSMLVGDVKQAIYRWRNGDWRILNNIDNEFVMAKIRSLDTNYRSSKNVIEFNNSVFKIMSSKLSQEYVSLCHDTLNNPFEKAYSDITQVVAKQNSAGFVSVDFFDRDEYKNVAEHLIEVFEQLCQKNYPASKICILCRDNRQIIKVSEQLKEIANNEKYAHLKAKNYFNLVSNDAFLLSASSAVKIIISALQVVETQNKIAAAELYFLWKIFYSSDENIDLSKVDIERIFDEFPDGFKKEKLKKLREKSLYKLINQLIIIFNLHQTQQSAYLFTFLDCVLNYQQKNNSDITSFLKYWEDELNYQKVSSNSSLSGIRIMTIHKSKGLEFNTVIVPFVDGAITGKTGASDTIIWCEPKQFPFDLPVFPIQYSKRMGRSYFAKEYVNETVMLYMDTLNVYYVAFTRAVENLFVFAQNPPKSSKTITIEAIFSDALEAKNGYLSNGQLALYNAEGEKESTNPFKNKQFDAVQANFSGQKDFMDNSFFVQSNSSTAFITSQEEQKKTYIVYGNVMHRIFANIFTENDVETAVDTLIFDGTISNSERQRYINDVKSAISESGVSNWFNGTYKTINERDILTATPQKTLKIYRPDRVMISDDLVMVIDYKFGRKSPAHSRQISNYITTLKSMNHNNIEGYIWYVNEREVERVLFNPTG